MRGWDKLMKGRTRHVFSGHGQRFSGNLGATSFRSFLGFFLIFVMAIVDCQGAGGVSFGMQMEL